MMLPTARAPADIDRYLAPAVLPVPMLQQSSCCAVALVAGMDRKVAVKGSDGCPTVTYTLHWILCGQHQ